MAHITIHTGTQSDHTQIDISWFDENNVKQLTTIEVIVQEQDKPRRLELQVNGKLYAILCSGGKIIEVV